MPDRLGSSVEVISSERAQRRQRMTVTWTGPGRRGAGVLRGTAVAAELMVVVVLRSSEEQVEEAEEVEEVGVKVPVL